MIGPRLRRVSFVGGLLLFGTAFAMGLVQAWHANHTIPDLDGDVMAQAKAILLAGSTESAVAQLRTYAHIEPGRAENWINLGEVLARLGHRDDAVAALERSLSLPITSGVTTHAATLQHLAVIYYELGRLDDARDCARTSRQMGGELPADLVRALALEGEPS